MCTATLGHISNALAPGGFLLMLEMMSPLAACIWGLDERTWRFTDEREFGLWLAKPRWQRLLREAGLLRVREHWCVLPPCPVISSVACLEQCRDDRDGA